MTFVSVCIPTHRRPESLERLLVSLVDQCDAPPFKVIVVDNDAVGSAEPVVRRFHDRLGLSYLIEPVRGLATVRNRAVGAADTPYVAFIDDDESAPPQWLANMSRTAARFDADVVVGGVQAVFEDGVADFVRACSLFDNSPREDGVLLPWYAARSGNALIRRESLPDLPSPFSTRFDLVGGEDVDLFKRMIDRGTRIVAAANADVLEFRPRKRANLRWVMRRAIRNGGTIADLQWRHFNRQDLARRFFHAVAELAGHTAQVGSKWKRDRAAAARHFVRACEEAGKILHLAGVRVSEYRVHP